MADYIPQHTPSQGKCCLCGVSIKSNPSNMCGACMAVGHDISEGISKEVDLFNCRNCERWQTPPDKWSVADLESAALLGICLKRLKGLSKVKLIDAAFVWTEPHSKRIRVKITIQKEVFAGSVLQGKFEILYIVKNLMCPACHREMAKQTWNSVIQLRQKVDHKKTFYFLEQVILKAKAHTNCVSMKDHPNGIDFYFEGRPFAIGMVEFLQSVMPVRSKASEQLISHNEKDNYTNMKYSYSLEIPPICKDDLLVLPPRVAQKMAHIGPVVVCTRVDAQLHYIDPTTLQVGEQPAAAYWKEPYGSLCQSAGLVEFMILDIELTGETVDGYDLAEAQVARVEEIGSPDSVKHVRTHLGRLLHTGDFAFGYDLSTANFNEANLEGVEASDLPDIVLIRKSYQSRKGKAKKRIWRLNQLVEDRPEPRVRKGKGKKGGEVRDDMAEFYNDLEEDPELRSHINIYKADNIVDDGVSTVAGEEIVDDLPTIRPDELVEERARPFTESAAVTAEQLEALELEGDGPEGETADD